MVSKKEAIVDFLKEIHPFYMNGERVAKALDGVKGRDKSKGLWGNLTKGEKAAYIGGSFSALGGAVVGAGYGAMQDEEGAVSRGLDLGGQIGGIAGAGLFASTKLSREIIGNVKMGSIAVGAGTTMLTSVMQDEDAGFVQRALVGTGSLAVGSLVGGLGVKGLSRFSKSIVK